MIRTCNGLELRDQIPPLPPTISLANFDPTLLLDHHILEHALAASCERNMENISINKCKLHGNSKPSSTTVSPHHRVQNIDLMNDIPMQFPLGLDNHSTSPVGKPSTPIFEHKSAASAIIGPLSSSCTTTTLASSTPNRRQFQSSIDALDNGDGGGGGGGGSSSNNILNDSKNVIKCTASASCGGADVGCSGDQKLVNISNGLKHRWHACPELHKAMDGVTYIADHTKKEQESTRVCLIFN